MAGNSEEGQGPQRAVAPMMMMMMMKIVLEIGTGTKLLTHHSAV
jgi:hypothetical protein